MKFKATGLRSFDISLEDEDLAKVFDFVGSNTDEQKSAIDAVISQLIDTLKNELDDEENVKAAANAMDFIITQGFASLMKVLEDNPDFLKPFVEQVLPQVINKVGETLMEMEAEPKAAISDFIGDVLRRANTPPTEQPQALEGPATE